MYWDSPSDEITNLSACSMNNRFIFMWNKVHVWKIGLETNPKHISFKPIKMNIEISGEENDTWVKKVRTSSDDNLVCIRVT